MKNNNYDSTRLLLEVYVEQGYKIPQFLSKNTIVKDVQKDMLKQYKYSSRDTSGKVATQLRNTWGIPQGISQIIFGYKGTVQGENSTFRLLREQNNVPGHVSQLISKFANSDDRSEQLSVFKF